MVSNHNTLSGCQKEWDFRAMVWNDWTNEIWIINKAEYLRHPKSFHLVPFYWTWRWKNKQPFWGYFHTTFTRHKITQSVFNPQNGTCQNNIKRRKIFPTHRIQWLSLSWARVSRVPFVMYCTLLVVRKLNKQFYWHLSGYIKQSWHSGQIRNFTNEEPKFGPNLHVQ